MNHYNIGALLESLAVTSDSVYIHTKTVDEAAQLCSILFEYTSSKYGISAIYKSHIRYAQASYNIHKTNTVYGIRMNSHKEFYFATTISRLNKIFTGGKASYIEFVDLENVLEIILGNMAHKNATSPDVVWGYVCSDGFHTTNEIEMKQHCEALVSGTTIPYYYKGCWTIDTQKGENNE